MCNCTPVYMLVIFHLPSWFIPCPSFRVMSNEASWQQEATAEGFKGKRWSWVFILSCPFLKLVKSLEQRSQLLHMSFSARSLSRLWQCFLYPQPFTLQGGNRVLPLLVLRCCPIFCAFLTPCPGGASGKEHACQCREIRDAVGPLGWEDLLEEGMATHCSTLAWRVPWTEEPGWLSSLGSQRVRHNWSDLAQHTQHTHTVVNGPFLKTHLKIQGFFFLPGP